MNKSEPKRVVYLDLLRILSAFAVVCIHVVSNSQIWTGNVVTADSWSIMNFFIGITRSAVPIFFMISGSLMLSNSEKYTFKRIATRNVLHMVTAFAFWTVFYVVTDLFLFGQSNGLSGILTSLLTGKVHLWYIFCLVTFYLVTPLLYKVIDSKRLELYLILLLLIPSVYDFIGLFFSYEPLDQFYMRFEIPAASYILYYVVGHYLSKYEIKKAYRYTIYALGSLFLILTLWMSDSFSKSGRSSSYVVGTRTSINIFLTAIAVFIFAKYVFSKVSFSEKTQKAISFVSKQTFGVYLVHYFVIEFSARFLHFSIDTVATAWLVPVLAVVFFAISFVISLAISKIPVLKKYII